MAAAVYEICKHGEIKKQQGGIGNANSSVSRRLSGVYFKIKQTAPRWIRSIDIANDMNYSKPSISVAMKNLRLNGYINVDESGFITLTDSGMEIASNIYDRHLILRKWLEFLGISPETAEQDACKIEHTLSKETYAALRKHIIEEMGEE